VQNTTTIKISRDEYDKFFDTMQSLGWRNEGSNNEYIIYFFRSPDGLVSTLYSSGKVVFQGNSDFKDIIASLKGDNKVNIEAHIGIDEVGKGDYFGPLVVVACFVDSEFGNVVNGLGFDDSKKFKDSKIMDLYSKVKEYEYYYPLILNPREYNDMVDECGNVSIVLAKQHTKAIEIGLKDLQSKGIECNRVVIDQFSSSKNRILKELGPLGKKIEIEQFHKGESDIAVACASIIARGIFLEEMDKMGKEYSFVFPKGASNVIESGREFVGLYGTKKLREVAKVGFKTTNSVLHLV
jgi:ribonuclease HIII